MKYHDFISKEFERILGDSEVDREEVILFAEAMVSDRPLMIDEVEEFLNSKFSSDAYMLDVIKDVIAEIREEEAFDQTANRWERHLGKANTGEYKYHGDDDMYRYGG